MLIPPRRRPAQRHPAGLERRPLRVHAPRPRNRARRRSTANAKTMIEPVFGAHQVQPPRRPLPTTRQIRRPLRMATDHRHPQPPQAPHRPPSRLKRRYPPQAALTEHRRPGDDPASAAPPGTNYATATAQSDALRVCCVACWRDVRSRLRARARGTRIARDRSGSSFRQPPAVTDEGLHRGVRRQARADHLHRTWCHGGHRGESRPLRPPAPPDSGASTGPRGRRRRRPRPPSSGLTTRPVSL